MSDKTADLAGPGISTYEEVAKILPVGYKPLLNRMDTQRAVFVVKRYIEEHLCRELNLDMVQVPLIVTYWPVTPFIGREIVPTVS